MALLGAQKAGMFFPGVTMLLELSHEHPGRSPVPRALSGKALEGVRASELPKPAVQAGEFISAQHS